MTETAKPSARKPAKAKGIPKAPARGSNGVKPPGLTADDRCRLRDIAERRLDLDTRRSAFERTAPHRAHIDVLAERLAFETEAEALARDETWLKNGIAERLRLWGQA